ncbi:MAG: phosphate ABC transporter permease PstA [Candidatus Glassbacteria bacterium]
MAAVEGVVFIRNLKNALFKALVIILALVSTIPLLLILFYICRQGVASINWQFLVTLPKPVGEVGGGIANAMVGTLILVAISSLLSAPLGISVGIYLTEFGTGKVAEWVRMSMEVLQGIPSIVIGIIAYLWIVQPLGIFSAFSGGVALALMMLPFIVRTTEETLRLVPESVKEASLALGVPYYRTVLKVILPAGLSGIITGVLVSMTRVAGETAPLLFTAFGNPFMNYNIFKPIHSLPLLIFNYAISPYEEWHSLAWGASFVLVVFVLILNLTSKVLARRWKVRY